MTMRRRLSYRQATAAAVAVAATVLAGCSSGGGTSGSNGQGDSAAGKPVYGGNLVIDDAQDAKSMNNVLTFDNTSIFIFEQIMQTLFTVTADGTGTQPLLAQGYTVSPDKKTYTIKLKPGIKFSDGKPMTAADVKFSIDADSAQAKTGWGYINAAIKSVEAPDASTVVINLKYPWAPLIADLSLFSNAVVPANDGGKTMDQFYQAPVGTGPFMWGQWTKGQSLKLVKNPNYWQKGLPYLNSVTFNVVPDSNTRSLQVEGNQADVDTYPDWPSFQQLQSNSSVVAKTFPSTELYYVTMNEKAKPFQDIHARRAISAMIDRKAIVKAALLGHGTPANSLLMPGVPFYQKDTPGIMLDPSLAKKELAASSVPNGFDTTLIIPSGDQSQLTIAQLLQSELKPYKINVKIQQLDPTAWHNATETDNYQMSIAAWTMDIPDPDEWTSFAIDPDGGAHSAFSWYNNPTVVGLNQQAEKTVDKAQRAAIYNQLQDQVAKDAPFAFLYYAPYAYALSKKLHGFDVTPLGNFPLQAVWKSK
jgi:peptide/nickel transport system substrate-binding protein